MIASEALTLLVAARNAVVLKQMLPDTVFASSASDVVASESTAAAAAIAAR